MNGNLLRNSSRLAHQILLNRRSVSNTDSRTYIRVNRLNNKFKASSSSHIAPTLLPSSSAKFSSWFNSSFVQNGFVGWYLGMIESRPILTKSLTAGFIFTAADLSSQMITLKSTDSLDLKRTLRMAGYGLLISGPSLHLWFNTVSRFIPKRDILNILKKMFLGQAFYGPLMTAVFFSVNAGLQGETSAEILARLKRDLIPTLLSGVVYWPLCDFITFKFTPVRLQPLVSNSFSFLWTIYITYMASLQKANVEGVLVESGKFAES